MMRIGVISDTHMPPFDDLVCSSVEAVFAGVDLILHAGDLVTLSVLDWLEHTAPVVAARGNNDTYLPADARLADVQVLDLHGTRVGMTHVLPFHRAPDPPPVPDLARQCGLDPLPDGWVFGDSHRDVVEWRDGVLLVNPGSPTSPHLRVDRPGTAAILTLDGGRPEVEIVHLPVPGHPGSHPLRSPSGVRR
jgi:hypothetical protein